MSKTEVLISEYMGTHATDLSVAVMSDGGSAVTWVSNDFLVKAQRYDSLGNAVGSELQFEPNFMSDQSSATGADVTYLNNGGFAVAWSSINPQLAVVKSSRVHTQLYDIEGNAVGNFSPSGSLSGGQYQPNIAGLNDGGFVLTFTTVSNPRSKYSNYELVGQTYDSEGIADGQTFQIDVGAIESPSTSITSLNDDGFIVTWHSNVLDGYNKNVYGQLYDSSGNANGSEFQVNTYTTNSQTSPSTTSLTDGGFVVTWESNYQDGDQGGIHGQIFDSYGDTVGDEFQVNTISKGSQLSPSVAGVSGGGFVVAWFSSNGDRVTNIYGQRYDSLGNKVGDEFPVNTQPAQDSLDQWDPSVVGLPSGDFIVTWSSHVDQQYGSIKGMYASQFYDNHPEIGLGNDTLNGRASNDTLNGGAGDDMIDGGAGDDTLNGGAGHDTLDGGAGDDTIILESNGTFGSDLFAYNVLSSLQAGTEESINLDGKTRFGDVMDGGSDVDTVELTDGSDAFFLHDSFSGFHSSLDLTADDNGKSGTARIANIENIKSGLGDDIVDLTSSNYSLTGQNITVDGGSGNDTLWGSDANETLKGGEGDDALFGGAGTNVLTGGAGADEFQFTKTSIADTVTDYDLTSGDQLNFFYETGSEEADWSFSILNGDLRWGANTIDFGAMEVNTLGELSIFVEEIGSGHASQIEYVPTLGEEILRLDLYPALYEQDYYSKIVTDLQFTELDDLATSIDIDMTFLGELNEVAVATGIEANGNGFIYSAGAVFNNTYNTVEIVADISNFKIDGIAANPISLQALLEATTIAPDKVGGLFNSITLSANSVDYLTLNHTANGLSLIYDNATNGMINELRLDGSFTNDLNKVIPVVSDLLNFDFSDPIALLGSQEFLDTSAYLDSSATLSGLSILQKGVANPYLQLTATDTTLNVAYKDWDIVGAIEVSETWQADPDAVLSTLQNLVTSTNELDLSELGSLYEGAGSLSLAIMHDQTGKLAEGVIHDFGDLIGSLDREAGDEFIFGKATGGSYAIDSNGLAAVVFKERELNEIQITELLDELDIRLEGEGGSSSTTTVSAAALAITLEGAGLQSDYFGNDILIIG